MRVILEEEGRKIFLEVILSENDEKFLLLKDGVLGNFVFGDLESPKFLNIFVRIEKRIEKMPLVKGKKARSSEGFSENIKKEISSGKKQKQAVAIAFSEANRSKKKAKKGEK